MRLPQTAAGRSPRPGLRGLRSEPRHGHSSSAAPEAALSPRVSCTPHIQSRFLCCLREEAAPRAAQERAQPAEAAAGEGRRGPANGRALTPLPGEGARVPWIGSIHRSEGILPPCREGTTHPGKEEEGRGVPRGKGPPTLPHSALDGRVAASRAPAVPSLPVRLQQDSAENGERGLRPAAGAVHAQPAGDLGEDPGGPAP
ncbi:hypothetical protein NDU88_009081 [Pleurodeles waltl]|uniref:Uncharacterized protein n=1 Tax=Pleurodeles waltl TaxID=8319 RepID=A0AAV7RU90_PLEWA|nr:hypothetical protein NDU88_009081 [Pleurodeles waltl]